MIIAKVKNNKLHIEADEEDFDKLLEILEDVECVELVKIKNHLSKSVVDAKVEDIDVWVKKEYRTIFKGKKRGAMGDIFQCSYKMALFLLTFKEYTKDDVLKAAKDYVNSFGNDFTYMRQADFFIFKEITHQGKKSITSTLLTRLEDGDEETNLSLDMFDSLN